MAYFGMIHDFTLYLFTSQSSLKIQSNPDWLNISKFIKIKKYDIDDDNEQYPYRIHVDLEGNNGKPDIECLMFEYKLEQNKWCNMLKSQMCIDPAVIS